MQNVLNSPDKKQNQNSESAARQDPKSVPKERDRWDKAVIAAQVIACVAAVGAFFVTMFNQGVGG